MRSIMHEKDGTCYLCRCLDSNNYYHRDIQEHHVFFGTANRKLSEKYGLKVYLCIYHHTGGPEAVHQNARNAEILKRDAQQIFEKTHTREEFMEIFGRNWLEAAPMQQVDEDMEECQRTADKAENAAGFQMLSEEESLIEMGREYMEFDKTTARRMKL